jgi:subtilisin family serine protease
MLFEQCLSGGVGHMVRRGRRRLQWAFITLGLVTVGCDSAPPAGEAEPDAGLELYAPKATESLPELVPGEAIVKFRKGVQRVDSVTLAGKTAKVDARTPDTALVRFETEVSRGRAAQVDATWAAIRELEARQDIEYAHPNWLFDLSRVPNDPLYLSQWHYPAILLPAAWDLTIGSPMIRIAILDTGRTTHPDLAAKWVPGLEYDAADEDGNATTEPDSRWRHGIHVAGIAGGESQNGLGSAGVCWRCQLLNVKVARLVDGDVHPDMDAVTAGIYWAVENGARVINMSFESNGLPCSAPGMSAIRDAVSFAYNRGVTVVAAAGNGMTSVANTVPASCPGVIAVAATDRNNALAAYSNRGEVTLAAPGGGGNVLRGDMYGAGIGCPADPASHFNATNQKGVVSTWTTSNDSHCYRYLSGTSMAAPHVAGVVGLMLSRNPSLAPGSIKTLLQISAQPLPDCADQCGAGLLNAHAAVQYAAALPGAGDAVPTPRFTFHCTGLHCTVDGRSSTDDHGIVSYQWSFPGQQLGAGGTTSFFMPGYTTHSVKLRVTDNAGQSAEIIGNVTPTQPTVTPQQGAYYNPQYANHKHSHGIDLFETTTGAWYLLWYTFEPDGRPVWYRSDLGPWVGARWSQPLYRFTWNGTQASHTLVGTVSLDLSSSSDAWFSWVLNGVPGGERLSYLTGGQGRSGAWYAPAESGWGIQVQESATELAATVAFYYQGQPRWMRGTSAPGSNATIPLTYLGGKGLCPSCGGRSAPKPGAGWAGSMNLQIADGAATTGLASTDITYFFQFIIPVWVRPLQPIQLLTRP